MMLHKKNAAREPKAWRLYPLNKLKTKNRKEGDEHVFLFLVLQFAQARVGGMSITTISPKAHARFLKFGGLFVVLISNN